MRNLKTIPFFLLLFKYSCLHLPPTIPPKPHYPHLPPLLLPPLVFSTCPLELFLKTLPPIIPSHLPSGYCQIVLNFNVSGCILLACWFCWLVSTYRWDHISVFHCLIPCLNQWHALPIGYTRRTGLVSDDQFQAKSNPVLAAMKYSASW